MESTVDFTELFMGEGYDFLRNDARVKNMFLLTLGGSHAYGMNVEGSDLDLRGGSLNSKEEILLGNDFEQVIDKDTDTTIYSFNKLIKLLSSCNPNVIEMLGCKKEHYIVLDGVGKLLLENRRMFLSKECIHTFGGYANSQLRRLENKSSRVVSRAEREAHILKSLESAMYCLRNRYKDFKIGDDILNVYLGKFAGELEDSELLLDISLTGYPLRDYVGLWSELKNIVSSYDRDSRRNKSALKRGKLGKHMAHLLRLHMMCIDILEHYDIITYRSDEHDLLMSVRNGDFLDANEQPTEEFYKLLAEYEKRIELAIGKSTIPDKPDIEGINKMKMCVNEMIVKNSGGLRIKVDEKLREGFCKDNGIPIKIFSEPYFTERLELYDKYYGCLDAWELFDKEVVNNPKYADAREYFDEYNTARNDAIDAIKNSEGFRRFNSEDMNKFAVCDDYRGLSKKDIYNPNNVGNRFVSVDIVRANFSCLRYYDPSIFDGSGRWEIFLGRFTGNKHILNSKYVRQVVFGNCNPKRQITYEKYLMSECLNYVLEGMSAHFRDNCVPVCLHNDEVVLDVTAVPTSHLSTLVLELRLILEGFCVPTSVEYFSLHRLPEHPGYFKEFLDGSREVEFKCVDANLLPFVIRNMNCEEVTEDDKVFVFGNRLAKYL